MRLRYAGTCRVCGTQLAARTEAVYDSATKTVCCLECAARAEDPAAPRQIPSSEDTPAAVFESPGIAGASARREYERRKAKDEQRLRERWGRLGGLAVALSDERQSTSAWAQGAIGEERLGARLDSLAGDGIAVLHDRRIPGSKANIDHIAITPSGIWVIDAKRYQGRPELKIEGGIFRPRTEKLVVGRRDCTRLVGGVLRQVEAVHACVPEVGVTGALCFVGADWPLIGGFFTTRGIHVLSPRRLARRVAQEAVGTIDVAEVRRALAARFKPA